MQHRHGGWGSFFLFVCLFGLLFVERLNTACVTAVKCPIHPPRFFLEYPKYPKWVQSLVFQLTCRPKHTKYPLWCHLNWGQNNTALVTLCAILCTIRGYRYRASMSCRIAIRWYRSRWMHLVIHVQSGVHVGSSGLAVFSTDLLFTATENTGWYSKQHQ